MIGFRSRHFGVKHMLVALVSQRVFGNFTYTIRHGLAAGMRRKGGLGFLPVEEVATPESRFLEALPLQGKVVYDIGAFEGVLTLFFAKNAKCVVAFEPNPRNFSRCVQNIRLNRLANVQVMNWGVSDSPAMIDFTYDPLMPGAGSGEASIVAQIGSSVRSAKKMSIPVLTLDEGIAHNGLPNPDIIKIDIEGMELPALRGMEQTLRRYRPQLFIEMHGATTTEKAENARSVLGFLESLGYRAYDVESEQYMTAATLAGLLPSHLWCTPGD